MIKICICDDQQPEQKKIKELVETFTSQHPLYPLRAAVFRSPYDLLRHLEEYGGFDIYLLDILMPGMNGLELSRKIHSRGENEDIIFLTTTCEYGVEAFEVRASDYLVKPIDPEKFSSTLLEVLKKRSAREIKYITLKTCDGTVRISQNDIIMIESINRERILTLVSGQSISTRLSLAELRNLLAQSNEFFTPHRSYIINLKYVIGFRAGSISMSNGADVLLSRKIYSKFKKKFMEIMF